MSKHRASDAPAPIELTFDLCPVFQVGSSKSGYPNEYSFSRSVELSREQAIETFDQSWVIRAAAGVGLPRGIDQDVYMAIVELLQRSGGMPEDHTLYFTLYELLEILGWHSGGDMRRRLKQSLERTASTTISATNAFWSTQNQTLISKTFKAFSVSFGHYSGAHSGLRERHRLVFDQFFAEHWTNTHDSAMNLPFYWHLEGHVARRLYRLIDLQASQQGKGGPRSWQIRLDELRDLMPLANYKYASLIKDKLNKAHDQLIEKGYLRAYKYYSPEGKRGPTLARYEVSSAFDKRRGDSLIEGDPAKVAAIQRMLAVTSNFKERMSRKSAVALVEKYGAEACLHYAEILPFRKEAKGSGLLVRAIKDGYDWELPSSASSAPSSRNTSGQSESSNPELALSDNTPEQSEGKTDPSKSWSHKLSNTTRLSGADKIGNSRHNPEMDLSVLENEDSESGCEPAIESLADDLFQDVLTALTEEGNKTFVGVFFEGTFARSFENGVLTLVVPNETARDYISKRFTEGIESALSEILVDRGLEGDASLSLAIGGGG